MNGGVLTNVCLVVPYSFVGYISTKAIVFISHIFVDDKQVTQIVLEICTQIHWIWYEISG